MLRSVADIGGYRLRAIDDEIGLVEDFYIDDYIWAVRHLVADVSAEPPTSSVLISPVEIGRANWDNEVVPVRLTVEEVVQSPDIHADLPVTLQRMKSCRVEDCPVSGWSGEPGTRIVGDPSLRSLAGIVGYSIQASDGEIGHVEDFVAETDDDWGVRFMIVATRDWLPGKKVLLSTEWITSVNLVYAKICVDLTMAEIKSKPEFDPSAPANREAGVDFLDYLDRPVS